MAEGHVIIDQGPTRITANQAIYNLDSKTGTFFNATGTMDPSMYFSGDRIEKVDEDTYRMTNGVFTSCDLDRPAWSFHVGHADVTLDDYARMRNISFRARGLPIFWTPRLIWPTKRDRSQGFLIPRARFTDKFGPRLRERLLHPDRRLRRRHALRRRQHRDATSAPASICATSRARTSRSATSARYAVTTSPAETASSGSTSTATRRRTCPAASAASSTCRTTRDLNFFREYDDDPRMLTLSNIYSSAYLTKNRPTYSLNILSDRRDYELLVARRRR